MLKNEWEIVVLEMTVEDTKQTWGELIPNLLLTASEKNKMLKDQIKEETNQGLMVLILFSRILVVGFLILIIFAFLDSILSQIFTLLGIEEILYQKNIFFNISIREIFALIIFISYLFDCLYYIIFRVIVSASDLKDQLKMIKEEKNNNG